MEAQLKSPSPATAALTIGSVSYLNAKPLIYGLDGPDNRDLKLVLDVPSKLGDGLRDKRFDVALLPVIDIQRIEGLNLLTSGGIGCDGPTLTVRIFSARPIDQIKTLACDPDSHTSVALARVILAEKYGIRPEFIELQGTKTQLCDARLLIGDKVVCEEPAGLEFQLDLGAAWKEMTGLPFVFAIWVAREGVVLRDLAERLEIAKREGLRHVSEIIARHAVPRGWPAGVALQYMTMYLKYDITPLHLEAIRRFHALAWKHKMLDTAPRPLVIAGESEFTS